MLFRCRNLFFRVCSLLQLNITPVIVVEGEPPDLKQEVMKKRAAMQYPSRGMYINGAKSKLRRKNFTADHREVQVWNNCLVYFRVWLTVFCLSVFMNSVLWYCWSGDRKCIQPLETCDSYWFSFTTSDGTKEHWLPQVHLAKGCLLWFGRVIECNHHLNLQFVYVGLHHLTWFKLLLMVWLVTVLWNAGLPWCSIRSECRWSWGNVCISQ